MSLSYEEALAALNNYPRREWRLGLDRMAAFCERLGLAGRLGETGTPAFIHIAGTNGKGTTTAFAQSLLVSQGYRTGAAYSPYVYDVRERVQLDRDLISREHFGEWVGRLLEVAESMESDPMGAPTEFEFKTALGFAYWNAQACDAVALEVGLGGHQCCHPRLQRHCQHRDGPHGVPRRHPRQDRDRKGRHHQARSPGGGWPDGR
jgi:dihydrofolate synthase/folylpolyglutamate synthase